jgi:hypothetical protein
LLRALKSPHRDVEPRCAEPRWRLGTGEVPAEVCARQMRAAYNISVLGYNAPPADLNEALEHYRLIRSEA